MRSKLQKFADFANALLPHEADYLLSVQRFEDGDKRRLLLQVSANCRKITGFEPYDQGIDKRKYSSLKAWIEEKLGAIDVRKGEKVRTLEGLGLSRSGRLAEASGGLRGAAALRRMGFSHRTNQSAAGGNFKRNPGEFRTPTAIRLHTTARTDSLR